jgi:adenylate cyclase
MARSQEKYELAAALFEQAAEVRAEDYQAMALAANMYEALGDDANADRTSIEALARARRATELNPKDARGWILGATCMLRAEGKDGAFEWVNNALKADPDSNGVAYNSACIHARVGDTDRALQLIERAIELGSRNRRYYETDPDFARFHDDPRFKALLDRI